MTERPIIFSGPMVRALLAGRKTQTRRLVRVPEIVAAEPDEYEPGERWDYTSICQREDGVWRAWMTEYPEEGSITVRAPARTGERLWVRETWNQLLLQERWIYRADHPEPARLSWKSPYHMPRAACRLVLDVTAVRAERLQDMGAGDAWAEGIPQTAGEAHQLGLFNMEREPGHEWDNRSSVENFSRLWDAINGKRAPWAENPWVWVLTVEVVQGLARPTSRLEVAHAR